MYIRLQPLLKRIARNRIEAWGGDEIIARRPLGCYTEKVSQALQDPRCPRGLGIRTMERLANCLFPTLPDEYRPYAMLQTLADASFYTGDDHIGYEFALLVVAWVEIHHLDPAGLCYGRTTQAALEGNIAF